MNTPTPQIQKPATGRRYARYSDDFKRQVVAACHEPDVSKAAIALANGLNPMPAAALDADRKIWRTLRKSAKGDGYLFVTVQPY